MKTTVINIKDAPKGWENNPAYTYIGRAGNGFTGEWGNPFHLKSEKKRQYVLDLYIDWLDKQSAVYKTKMVHDLDSQILVCFCKPKACHGDVIVQFIEDWWNGYQ